MRLGEYLLTVAVLSCAVGVLEYLYYPSRARDAAAICASVILVHALLSPVLSFAASLSDGSPIIEVLPPTDIPFEDAYKETAEEAFGEGIRKLVCANYGLSAEDVSVSVEGFDITEMTAKRVKVTLSGTASLSDHRGMEAYLNGLSLGKCEVRIRIG